MHNLATAIERGTISHEAGTVTSLKNGRIVVCTPSGSYHARRATGCLLDPRADDVVELALVQGGDCYVLTVLERAEGEPSRISVDGDLEFSASGRIRMAARAGIDLVSEGEMGVVAARLAVRVVEATAAFERLSALGKYLHSRFERVRSTSSTVDVVAERVTQTVERYYRFVGEVEQLRAERLDYQAAKTIRMHANSTVITADELVKLDGGQIHMG